MIIEFRKNRTISIIQHAMIGAPHWYVISGTGDVFRKFNHLKDAKEYALKYALPENIEVSD